VLIASQEDISLLRAYARDLPSTKYFATDGMVLAVPTGNPGDVRRTEVEDLPPDAVCTPPFMLEGTVALDEAEIPLNEDAPADCGATTVDAVASGDLDAALVPGSAITPLLRREVEGLALRGSGGVFVTYGMVVASETEAAVGFGNFVDSREGRILIRGAGYK
jgi:hypothetical protein